jgi:hypothetical protein
MGLNVRFGSKANIGLSPVDVRFTPKSGHQSWLGLRPAAWRYSLRLIGVGNFAARGCKAS